MWMQRCAVEAVQLESIGRGLSSSAFFCTLLHASAGEARQCVVDRCIAQSCVVLFYSLWSISFSLLFHTKLPLPLPTSPPFSVALLKASSPSFVPLFLPKDTLEEQRILQLPRVFASHSLLSHPRPFTLSNCAAIDHCNYSGYSILELLFIHFLSL